MIERAIKFGDGGNLVGILTEPEFHERPAERPAAIFLNSGILHRVGASRLHVRMARRLAQEGCTAFRFDFSGIGDSDVRRDRKTFRESAILETREAIDLLARTRGETRFILAGLCSGADISFWTAQEDERVVGLVQLDPFAYRTPRYYMRRYLPRVASPRAWSDSLRARAAHLASRLRPHGKPDFDASASAPRYRRRFPPREEVAEAYRSLTARSVAFYLFFSNGMSEYLNYAEQYLESFPEVDFGGRIQVDFVPDADHTLTAPEHQQLVTEAVAGWIQRHWPAAAPEQVAR